MLRAFLQPLGTLRKGVATNSEASQSLGLTQGAHLSTILFIIYTDDLDVHGKRYVGEEVQVGSLGNAEISLTAGDGIIFTRKWTHAQLQEVEDENTGPLMISVEEIKKSKDETYLGITLTNSGITDKLNVERGQKAITITSSIATTKQGWI